MSEYFKSPMNYIGNKYKLLSQIVPLFPDDIDTFVDLFCGGLDISLNVSCDLRYSNDKEVHIIDFYKNLQNITGEDLDKKLLEVINKYSLSITNAEGYNALRADYNKHNNKEEWVLFYALIAYSFNHQIRYNSKEDFNMPFGKNRSCYNPTLQKRVIEFANRIDNTYHFSNLDFRKFVFNNMTSRSFVYADPPYLITTATYNENGGWGEQDERDLLKLLDIISDKGIKFGISNVLSQNGKENEILQKWSEKYKVHHLDFNYSNSSYHRKDRDTEGTDEVFICNYDKGISNS